MKKKFKIILGLIGIIILLFLIDIVLIFTINRPIFAIKDASGYVYNGLFYDTYICSEYSVPQVKLKGTKFSCSFIKINVGKVVSIKDISKDIKDFACADALESFYEDDNYTYYWSCIKNNYVIVEYENGYKEKVSDALKYGTITMKDLDNYNIQYVKYENK